MISDQQRCLLGQSLPTGRLKPEVVLAQDIPERLLRPHQRLVGTFEGVFGHTADDAIKSLWDFSREMTARITWKPYMFSRRLPRVLGEIEVPTLVIWGGNDRVVPLSCANQYVKGLANARIEVVAGAGHLVELEEPERVASLIGS